MMNLLFRSATVACAFSALIGPALADELIPHRVAYDLALESNGQISDVSVNMKGRMVYEFTGNACEGYTVNFRFVLETGDGQGNSAVTDLRNKNFESGDGNHFDFRSQTFVNEVQTEDLQGTAVRQDDKVDVKLKLTENTEFSIDKPIIFPTAQLIKTLAEARKGTTVFSDDIYDGSDGGQHIFHTSTVIGNARTTAPDESEKPIGDLRRWPVTVSYFGAEAGDDQPPDYSISFDLWENGVSSRMRLDYGDFVLDGKIAHFERLPESPCVASSAPVVAPSSEMTPPSADQPSSRPASQSQEDTGKTESGNGTDQPAGSNTTSEPVTPSGN